MAVPGLGVWPPLPPDVYLRQPAKALPFPLQEPTCRVFAWARQALWHGVQAVGLVPGDVVLMPAYHHGSEVEALARAGLVSRFYEGAEDLQPDERELEALLGPRVRALYLIHYLGFPQDALRWRRWCDERRLLLVEDAAQAWLGSVAGRPVGSYGDLAVFCLYKTFGLPEGAAVVSNSPLPSPRPNPRLGVADLARRHGAWLEQRSASLAALAARMRRSPMAYRAERDFALGDPDDGPWASLRFLLPRISDPHAAAQRRDNYRRLLDELGDRVRPPFDALADGASPFAFPFHTDRKAALLERLAGHGIRGLDFWSVPHPALPAACFPGAASRRTSTVALPVHQELRPQDLDRIVHAVGPKPARRAELELQPVRDLGAVRDEWTALALRSGSVFATWEWAATWWRHLGRKRPLRVVACRRVGGELVAILPMYVASRGPAEILRFVGHGLAGQLGPVCDPAGRPAAARALRRLLASDSLDGDLFIAEQFPGDQGWSGHLGGKVLRREGNPVLRVGGRSWEEILAARSANFREQIRRRERKLAREHELRYRLADDPDRLGEDLDTLIALHEARWAGAESDAFVGPRRAFHQDFAAQALERGWLRLWFLELDGRPVAAWYGFRYGGAEFYYQAGRDPAWNDRAVGFVLLAHSIREAVADGVREYRLLRGGDPYKGRFADADPGLETIAVARSARGRALLAGAAAAANLPPGPKRSALKFAGLAG